MATLKNEGKSGLGLPGRTGPDGESRGPSLLGVGASIEVPAWYVAALRAEKGVAALIDRDGGISVIAPVEIGSDDLEIEDDEADLGPTAPKVTKKKKR